MTNWGDILSMLTLFSAVVGAIQWLISKAVVSPAIERQTRDVTIMIEGIKKWAKEEFPTSVEFRLHKEADEAHQESMDRELERIWRRLDK
jgi:hypothetical protein